MGFLSNSKATSVAVVILNYNSSDDCEKCISSLQKQEGVDLDIIVVDNCSSEKDCFRVKSLCEKHDLCFISNQDNRGYNAGNNVGLRYASSKGHKYALIANPDMEFPEQDYIAYIAHFMQKDLNIATCGSDIQTPEGIHQNPKVRKIDSWLNSFDWVKYLVVRGARGNIPDWTDNSDESHVCRSLNGCCFMIRVDFLEKINFFDERVFLYGEEPILGRQIELSGLTMYYLSEKTAIHAHEKTKEKGNAFRFRHWRHSMLHYVRCYGHYPVYGKWLAIASIHIYFFSLSAMSIVKRMKPKHKEA